MPKTTAQRMTSNSPYFERMMAYFERVLTGERHAGRWEYLAVKRMAAELSDKSSPYMLDLNVLDMVCGFYELMPHIKGKWAVSRVGKPNTLVMEGWQIFTDGLPWAMLAKKTGLRRFRMAFVLVARKNGKSFGSSAGMVYALVGADEPGPEVYAAASSRDQASIVFKGAQKMILKCPALMTEFGLNSLAHFVECSHNDGIMHAVSSEARTLEGKNVSYAVCDEIHVHPDMSVIDVLGEGMGSREQPMLRMISTAGKFSEINPAWIYTRYTHDVLTGKIEDPTFFGVIYSAEHKNPKAKWKPDVEDPIAWEMANPNLGVSVMVDDIAARARLAKNIPSKRTDFMTKRLNLWVGSADSFVDQERWKAGADPHLDIDQLAGCECRISMDLARVSDLCVILICFKLDAERYAFFSRAYLPETTVQTKERYVSWAEEGVLQVHPGGQVSEREVLKDIEDWVKRFDPLELLYDPWESDKIIQALENHVDCVEFKQNVSMYSPAMRYFEGKLANGLIAHPDDPVMNWCMGNVEAHEDRNENIYPRKPSSDGKIDIACCVFMALAGFNSGEYESAYDDDTDADNSPLTVDGDAELHPCVLEIIDAYEDVLTDAQFLELERHNSWASYDVATRKLVLMDGPPTN